MTPVTTVTPPPSAHRTNTTTAATKKKASVGVPPPAGEGGLEVAMDAAAACYLRLGVATTTAADIAREAGISRATLYRRYGSHEAIFLAVLTRESEAMSEDARAHLDSLSLTDPGERTLEGMMFAIDQIRSRPVHAAVFGGESAAWAAGQAIRMAALRRIGEAGVSPLVAAALADGSLSERDVEDLVDWNQRILISYAAVPGYGDRPPAEIRRQLTSWFLPAFQVRVGAQ